MWYVIAILAAYSLLFVPAYLTIRMSENMDSSTVIGRTNVAMPPILKRAYDLYDAAGLVGLHEGEDVREASRTLVLEKIRSNPREFIKDDVEYLSASIMTPEQSESVIFHRTYRDWDMDTADVDLSRCAINAAGLNPCRPHLLLYAVRQHYDTLPDSEKTTAAFEVSYPWMDYSKEGSVMYKTSVVVWCNPYTFLLCGLSETLIPAPLMVVSWIVLTFAQVLVVFVFYAWPGYMRRMLEGTFKAKNVRVGVSAMIILVLSLSSVNHYRLRESFNSPEEIEKSITNAKELTAFLLFGVSAAFSLVQLRCECNERTNRVVLIHISAAVACAMAAAITNIPYISRYYQYIIRIELAMIIDFQIWMAAFTLCAVVCMILTRENTVDILRGSNSKTKTSTGGGNDPGRLRSGRAAAATRRGQQ